MNIIGKSRITQGQLISKRDICKNLEIQLYDEFQSFFSLDNLYQEIVSTEDIDVKNLHVPILRHEDINLEYISNKTFRNYILNSFVLAQRLAEYYKHNIKIILHSGFSYTQYQKFPILYDEVINFLESALTKYPNVDICIENLIPFIIENNGIQSKNGFLYDNVELVKHFRSYFNTDRFYTVLDTCHLLVTIEIISRVFSPTYTDMMRDIDIESYFIENKDVIGLLHLSDVEELGYLPKQHGIKFQGHRLHKMYQFIDLYLKYNMSCDITLEIQEEDYEKSEAFKENYTDLTSYLNSKNIAFS